MFNKKAFAGLFLTSISALMLGILLTRVFSFTSWYTFAFFAISLPMFGFTVGALFVYLGKNYFSAERLYERLALFALLFAISIDIALLLFLALPFRSEFTGLAILASALTYTVIAIPFVFAGVVINLSMTSFSEKIGLVYGAVLMGAGLGAFLAFPVLNALDAPSAIMLSGAIAALGAISFASEGLVLNRRLKSTCAIIFLILAALMALNSLYHPLRVERAKVHNRKPHVQSLSALSGISVYPFRLKKTPYSRGISRSYDFKNIIGERVIEIDGVFRTVMTLYDGKPDSVKHLKYYLSSIAHYLRPEARVFIIGLGGGREILAAKTFGQKEVVAAEVNNKLIEMTMRVFGDFTGHLDRLPGVRIINENARSALRGLEKKFDIIQANGMDTGSAGAAAALSLSENSVYTVEGLKTFFRHLTPEGVLTFNMWYYDDYPAEVLRLASLAAYTLKHEGVVNPAEHIMIVKSESLGKKRPSATILISKDPFSPADLKTMTDTVKKLQFEFVFNPVGFRNKLFVEAIKKAGNRDYYASTPLDISPPRDNRPFFFNLARGKDLFSTNGLMKLKEQGLNLVSLVMLFVLAVFGFVLSFIFILITFFLGKGRMPAKGRLSGFAFFGAMGMGYIFVEMALLQRLIIFLGHPVYSISVVIFALLFSSGLGAIASSLFTGKGKRPAGGLIALVMGLLVLLLLHIIFNQTAFLAAFIQTGLYTRVALSLLTLIPIGFVMGIPLPIGMTIAANNFSGRSPWFLAVTWAMSLVAALIGVWLSLGWGFTAMLWAGLASYVVAGLTLLLFSRTGRLRNFGG